MHRAKIGPTLGPKQSTETGLELGWNWTWTGLKLDKNGTKTEVKQNRTGLKLDKTKLKQLSKTVTKMFKILD